MDNGLIQTHLIASETNNLANAGFLGCVNAQHRKHNPKKIDIVYIKRSLTACLLFQAWWTSPSGLNAAQVDEKSIQLALTSLNNQITMNVLSAALCEMMVGGIMNGHATPKNIASSAKKLGEHTSAFIASADALLKHMKQKSLSNRIREWQSQNKRKPERLKGRPCTIIPLRGLISTPNASLAATAAPLSVASMK